MRTLLELERICPGRWRLRVRREDAKGNVTASAAVETDPVTAEKLGRAALRAWCQRDEEQARGQQRGRR